MTINLISQGTVVFFRGLPSKIMTDEQVKIVSLASAVFAFLSIAYWIGSHLLNKNFRHSQQLSDDQGQYVLDRISIQPDDFVQNSKGEFVRARHNAHEVFYEIGEGKLREDARLIESKDAWLEPNGQNVYLSGTNFKFVHFKSGNDGKRVISIRTFLDGNNALPVVTLYEVRPKKIPAMTIST